MSTQKFYRSRRLAAEALGTCALVATVVGSGIMADALAGGNDAVALLGNTIATGAILYVLITIFGPISGAHFNPAVTMMFRLRGDIDTNEAAQFVVFQILGAIAGTLVAHAMFELPLVDPSMKVRTGPSQWFAEAVATFGLVSTILGCIRFRPDAVATGVGLYITAGYWFTASTSFANPAVTIGRTLTDTFSGIQPVDAPMFIVAQLVGAAAALYIWQWFLKAKPKD